MHRLALAITFLTILPVPRRGEATPVELAAAMAWFPAVGLILGGILALTAALLPAPFTPPAAAAILVALLIGLTRGLHLDGLADTLDGLGGGRTPADALRIMKDHAVGAFGAAGLVAVLLLKYGLLTAALSRQNLPLLLIFPVVSRFAMVLLAYLSPYARPEGGLGQAMTTLTTGRTLAWAAGSAVVVAAGLGGRAGLYSLAGVALLSGVLAAYFRRRLGGVTGDVCGAVNELTEVAALFLGLLLA
jgi:adenosylcobinamide-GDP ribazoletransferase